jgi:hypothetical protein
MTVLNFSARADAVNQGVYVSEFDGTEILGYKSSRQTKSPPLCKIKNVSSVSGIAVDAHGNFIEPDGGTQTISVYRGPQMCGELVSFMKDPYGYPTDAASVDAVKGTIVVANSFDFGNSSGEGPGSISVCKLGPGCTRNLTNASMYQVAAVAFDNSGNCFASAGTVSGKPRLVYFKGCSGKGTVATGYQNVSPGGLDFDKSGNLVSLDTNYSTTGRLFVYRGCKPKCGLVGGPYILHGNAAYGHLNEGSDLFYAANFNAGQIDAYTYTPSKVKYVYSFKKGLEKSQYVSGVAVNPRSVQ